MSGLQKLSSPPDLPSKPLPPGLTEIQKKGEELVAVAGLLSVTDQDSFQAAADLRRQIRRGVDTLEALQRPNIERLHLAHKAALADLKTWREPFDKAESALKKAQDDFQREERKKREEEARRFEEMRRKVQEDELARQLKEAAQRVEEEPEKAEAESWEIIERMSEPPAPLPVVHAAVKAEGSSTRTVPSFRLLDVEKLDPKFILRTIRDEIARKGECSWLMSAIGAEVRERKNKSVEDIVGRGSIEYYEDVSTGVRR